VPNFYRALTVILLTASACASSDPFVGTWILNQKRSVYPAGSCPKSMIISMEATGKGIRYSSNTVFANGSTAHSQYEADYNGREVIVTGNRGMLLPVSLKRAGPRTVIAYYTRGSQITASSRRVVSQDGHWMRITTKSKDLRGKSVTVVGVYEKKFNPVVSLTQK